MYAKFRHAHATHPDWAVAVEECLLHLQGQSAAAGYVRAPNLGFLYLTDQLAAHAQAILTMLKGRTGISSWVGASGAGICATGAECVDEPALAVMLGQFTPGTFNVFSGNQRPPAIGTRTHEDQLAAWTALVHADPQTPDLPALLEDMSYKLASASLWGGVASGRNHRIHIADQILSGGLSGVVFSERIGWQTALAQGCFPLPQASAHTITASAAQKILTLDGQRAFDVLLKDAGLGPPHSSTAIDTALRDALHTLARQGLFVGLAPRLGPALGAPDWGYLIRHLYALEPESGAVVTTADDLTGQRMIFCTRDEAAARAELTSRCAQLLEACGGRQAIQGVIYISCLGRGSHLFGETGQELALIQSELGPVPLVGFYASGEISGRDLYQYSGVLIAFSASSKNA
ncbi:MAG TPA: FIST N-terminal domain-containing protein [Burkholderiaceae bacterium]|nr:FIST N-terminal domain-containing protein [Burkholderiaceae bacterium]